MKHLPVNNSEMIDNNKKEQLNNKTVISVSRRTDIPAFYTPWFLKRIKEGKASYKNPFTGKTFQVSLKAKEVHSFVFWSRNYSNLIPHLGELRKKGYVFYFHFTITGYPKILDPSVIKPEESIKQLQFLSNMFSPDHVQWRFDPLLITDITSADHLIYTFSTLAKSLRGFTKRCYISFAHLYGKVRRNLNKLEKESGLKYYEIPDEEKFSIAQKIAGIAAEHGIKIFSCCCPNLIGGLVEKAHCIDEEILRALFPDRRLIGKISPTRKGCGCFSSRDIGAYNTCPQGCIYCYANTSPDIGKRSFEDHRSISPSLLEKP